MSNFVLLKWPPVMIGIGLENESVNQFQSQLSVVKDKQFISSCLNDMNWFTHEYFDYE